MSKSPLFAVLSAACLLLPLGSSAGFISAGTPSVSGTDVTYDLNGYNRYSPTGVDILYWGDSGTWTVDYGALGLVNPGTVDLTFTWALDDHYAIPVGLYTADITVNGTVVYSGNYTNAVHGSPYGLTFTNFNTFTLSGLNSGAGSTFSIGIQDTSGATTDWVAIDSFTVSAAVPEPSVILGMISFGAIGLLLLRRRRG